MAPSLSERIRSIEGSRTVAITGLIDELAREGKQVINLAVGEPEDDTPAAIVEATKTALDNRNTRYGPVAGLTGLRERLAGRLSGCSAENILLTNGSKQALYMIFQCLCNPGEEVIIPVPYWVSFSEQVKLAGGVPVFVPTEDHQLDLQAIEAAITPKTRIILINSPNNPTGAVYPPEILEGVGQLAAKHDLTLLADEAYDAFVFDGAPRSSVYDLEHLRNRCVVTRSFSKSWSMTGFRVGYVAASEEVTGALAALQSHLSGNVCTFAQYGALAALSLDEALVAAWRSELQRKRDIAFGHARELFSCIRPQGAFYLFPDVSDCLRRNETSVQLAERLLRQAGVAVVPGEAFGAPGHIRISFAVSEETLKSGFERLADLLRSK